MQNVMGIDVSKEKLDICALFDGKMKIKIVENFIVITTCYQSIFMKNVNCYADGR